MSSVVRELRRAEDLTDSNPTQGQIQSGTYHKGKVTLKGFTILIENPAGTTRKGVDAHGETWETTMRHTYGEFINTIGSDGDPVDVFIGPAINKHFDVYVIDQVNEETRQFDEHKVMFGFGSEREAVRAYLSNYQKGWTGFSNLETFSLSEFKIWLDDEKCHSR